MKYIMHTSCVALLLFATSALAINLDDGTRARDVITDQTKKMFNDKEFAKLDAMADKFRTSKSRFTDGGWKLRAFYNGFNLNNRHPEWVFSKYIAFAEEWRRINPTSVTAQVVLAKAWLSYAWKERGGGYASEVKEDAWPLVHKRLDTAWKIINERPAPRVADCPERHCQRLTLARARGIEKKQFESLFKDAVRQEPGYYPNYSSKAEYLLPKWHGNEGEWQRYIIEVADKNPGGIGATIYTRVVWIMSDEWKSFKGEGVSWDRMKAGFMEIDRNYHNSPLILNTFARFACLAGDRKTLKALFKRIDSDHFDADAWGKIRVDDCRSLAGLPTLDKQITK